MKDLDYEVDYECDIHIWKTLDMKNSKIKIEASNTISILTATTSYIENLLRLGFLDENSLQHLCELALKGSKGELENDEDSN